MKFPVPLLSLLLAIACFLCAADGGREMKHPRVHMAHVNITNVTKTVDGTAGVGNPIHPDKLLFEADKKCEEEEEEEEEEEVCEECEEEDHECEECDEEKLVLEHGLVGHHLLHGEPKGLHKNNVPLKNVP